MFFPIIQTFHWEIKGRFRKRVVLANVPSFRFSFRGNIRQNHPFGNRPFANPRTLAASRFCLTSHQLTRHVLSQPACPPYPFFRELPLLTAVLYRRVLWICFILVESETKNQPKEEVLGHRSLRTSSQNLRSGPPNPGKKAFWRRHAARMSTNKNSV